MWVAAIAGLAAIVAGFMRNVRVVVIQVGIGLALLVIPALVDRMTDHWWIAPLFMGPLALASAAWLATVTIKGWNNRRERKGKSRIAVWRPSPRRHAGGSPVSLSLSSLSTPSSSDSTDPDSKGTL
jgi:hypothetical protein